MENELKLTSNEPGTWDYAVEDESGAVLSCDGVECTGSVYAEQEDVAYDAASSEILSLFGLEI
jgi:hypothetical protein